MLRNFLSKKNNSILKLFIFGFISIQILFLNAVVVNAKFTTFEKQQIELIAAEADQASGLISADKKQEAAALLASANGLLTSLYSKVTDNLLLAELQRESGNLAAAQSYLAAGDKNNALAYSSLVSTSLRTSSQTATDRNAKTPSSTTNTDTTPTAEQQQAATAAAEAAAKSNAEINSGVQITGGQSFDTILGEFFNPLEFKTVPELIIRLINIGLLLAAMVAVVVIISAGFTLVTAAGSEAKITQGKKAITWAITGLIVCLMSFSIVAIIQNVIS